MMWVIRGTNTNSGEDFAMVVEANSQAAAECWALKRSVPVVCISEACEDDVAQAKRTHQLWKYTAEPRYTCFGRPVAMKQIACLLICGVLTMGLVFARTYSGTRYSLRHIQSALRG